VIGANDRRRVRLASDHPVRAGLELDRPPAVGGPEGVRAGARRIGDDGFLVRKRPTLMFNGYADQVAGLYAGMDLKRSI
jgi:sulfoxide reductase catalytic subunit YedY